MILTPSYLKAAGIALGATALFGAGWHLKGRSMLADQAVAAQEALQGQQQAVAAQHLKDLSIAASDAQLAKETAMARGTAEESLWEAQRIIAKLTSGKKTVKTAVIHEKDGSTSTCPAIADSFVQNYNALSTGSSPQESTRQ